jgi:hypothetical protein
MKKIEDHLLAVFNAMTKNKEDWQYVTDEQKEKYWFIINRNLSKIYPYHSEKLNIKDFDKKYILDIWFNFLKDKPYNVYSKKFWSKPNLKSKSKEELLSNDILLLSKKINLNNKDILFLFKYYKEELIEELKYLKSIEKNN